MRKTKQRKFEKNQTSVQELWIFKLSVNPLFGDPWVGIPPNIWCNCGILVLVLVLYIIFHKISIYMKFQMRNQLYSFRNVCRFDVAISYSNNKSEEFSLFMQKFENCLIWSFQEDQNFVIFLWLDGIDESLCIKRR